MTPNIRKGVVKTAYKRWLVEYHNPQKVVTIEFLGWHYGRNKFYKTGVPYPFTFRGAKYIGEIWLCQVLATGEQRPFIFKHLLEVIEDNSETSYRDREDEVIDLSPNLLLDTYEEFIAGTRHKRHNPNKTLRLQNIKFAKRLEIIRILLNNTESGNKKKGLFLILRHKEAPTVLTLSTLKKWKEQYPEVYQEIMTEVSGLMT